jgi:hypothetical protein
LGSSLNPVHDAAELHGDGWVASSAESQCEHLRAFAIRPVEEDEGSTAPMVRRIALATFGGAATWTDALGWLRNRAEMIGIVVVINGVVGNNTRRKLIRKNFAVSHQS